MSSASSGATRKDQQVHSACRSGTARKCSPAEAPQWGDKHHHKDTWTSLWFFILLNKLCRKQPKDVFKVESCVCFCWIPTQSCSYVCYPSQDKPPFGSSHHHNSNGAMGVHNRWFRGGKIWPFQSSKKRDIPFMFLAYSNGDRKCQKLLLLGKTVSKQRRKAVQVNPSGCNQNHHFTQWMSNNQNSHGQDRLLIFPDSSQSTWNQSYPNHFSEGTGPNTQITAFILHWFLHHRQAVQLPFSFSHCFAWIAKITATV